MARILVGWELGGERGHVALMEPVVAALRERGHELVVAVKDVAAVAGGPDGPTRSCLAQGQLLQAPAWPEPKEPQLAVSETVADDMVAAGLSDEQGLHERARQWASLIDLLGIDLVLAETAPTLLLAARSRCPAIAFGSGYSLPPAGRLLTPVLDLQRSCSPASVQREENLRRVFDATDRELGGGGLEKFSDLFDVPVWVCNLPDLDPYASIRAQPAAGPLQIRLPDEALLQARNFSGPGEKVFIYIKPFAGLPALLDALVPQCRQAELYIAHAPPNVENPWSNVVLHRAPVDLSARLHEFSAVVHFGGLNLAAEALFAGVPQLIVPQHLEQSASALAVQKLAAGHCRLNIPREPERESDRQSLMAGLVRDFLGDETLLQRADALGAQLRSRQQPSLPGLVRLCESLL